MRHAPSKRTEVHNLIRQMLDNELKVPASHPKYDKCINLGLGKLSWLEHVIGEPTKANGYDLPPVIGEAIIEQVKKETCNGYTDSSGTADARKAIVEK